MKGLIHIYEGDGKGKTTTSVGLSIRCAGNGGKVLFSQFLKDNKSSELKILNQIENIQVVGCEKEFGFIFNMTEEEKVEPKTVYRAYLKKVTELAVVNKCRMLVLDEIIASYNYEMVDKEFLINFLKNKPDELEVVMTGRNPAPELVEIADYVSRIQKIKHPFDAGIPARIGIEK